MSAWVCECGEPMAVRDDAADRIQVVKPCRHGRPPARGAYLPKPKAPEEPTP